MAYTKTTWISGDTISSEKLNKMEQGIADAHGALDRTIAKQSQGIDDASNSMNTNDATLASTGYVAGFVMTATNGRSDTIQGGNGQYIKSLTLNKGRVTEATFENIPTVPDATTTSKGIIQVGDNLSISNNGILSANYSTEGEYNSSINPLITKSAMTQALTSLIPQAITVQNGKLINSISQVNGEITVDFTDIPKATGNDYGYVKIGNGLNVENGVISVSINSDGTLNPDSLNATYTSNDLCKTVLNVVQSNGKITAVDFQPIPDAVYTPGNVEEQTSDTYTHGLISATDLEKLYILNFDKGDDFEYFLINSRAGRKGWVRGINNFIVYDTLSIQDLEVTDTSTQQSTIIPAKLQIGETSLNEDQLKDLLELLNTNNNNNNGGE